MSSKIQKILHVHHQLVEYWLVEEIQHLKLSCKYGIEFITISQQEMHQILVILTTATSIIIVDDSNSTRGIFVVDMIQQLHHQSLKCNIIHLVTIATKEMHKILVI